VQGTIKHYDEEGRTGVLLTDDRTEVSIDDRSLGDAFIQSLRIGQRVRFELERTGDGGAVARDLRLVTF
jgi:cold shock CspA family protein